ISPARGDSQQLAALVIGRQRCQLVVVGPVGVLQAECLLAAGQIAVLERSIMGEMIVLVTTAEFDGVGDSPGIVRIGDVAEVDVVISVVAHIGRKRKKAPPAWFRYALLRNLARVWSEVTEVNGVLLRKRIADHREVGAA